MAYRLNRGDLWQAVFLGIALMIWGAVGVGGFFGGGVWRLLSALLLLAGLAAAVLAYRRARR